jgi:hypothetical protein
MCDVSGRLNVSGKQVTPGSLDSSSPLVIETSFIAKELLALEMA